MRKITGVNETLKNLEEGQQNLPTFREVFRLALALSLAESKDKAIWAGDLAEDLKKHVDNDLTLEEHQYFVLKYAVEHNPQQLTNYYWGQVLKKVDSAEQYKAG